MISRTVLLTAWLCSVLSFGAAAQTVVMGEAAVLTAGDKGNGNEVDAQEASLSQSATIQSMSFYVTGAAGKLVLGIYDATGPSGGPGHLVAQTAAFTPKAGWNVASTTTHPTLAAGNYWLVYAPSNSSLAFVKENNNGNCRYYSLRTFSTTLPATYSATPKNCTPATWSLYATLATTATPTLSLTDSPTSPSVPANAPVGTVVTALTASWNNGSTFTGTLSFVSPYSSDGSLFRLSGNNIVVNGSLAGLGSTTQEITVQAQQSSSVSLNIPIAVTATADPPPPPAGGGGAGGDPTVGVLPSYNDAYPNWAKAGMQSVGGIPYRTTQCGATLTPLGGGQFDTTQINNAIAACPAGEVVQLGSGTFTINEGNTINVNSGVTLRGTGSCNNTSSPYCATVITVHNGAVLGSDTCGGSSCSYAPAILLGPPRFTEIWTSTALTTDAAQGETSVTVASTSGFSVGQWALIDEASGAAYVKDPAGGSGWPSNSQVWAASDFVSSSGSPATGRVAWQKHNPSESSDDFSSSTYPYTSGSTGCYFSNCDRPTAELHKITAISGDTISFDSPLTIAYRQSGGHNAQLYYFSEPLVTNASVENLTVTNSDGGGVSFQFCAYCWAKSVETTMWLNGGFVLEDSPRVELNTVFSHIAAWPIPGGAEYAIDMQWASTEDLLTNSISLEAGKALTIRSAGAGSVVSYNYMDDVFIGSSPGWQEMGANGSHAAGSHMTLFEGNYTFNLDNDVTHGNVVYHTYYRNRATGFRAAFTDYFPGYVETINDIKDLPGNNGPLRAAGGQMYDYWHAYVGNVLGTSGATTAANGWSLNACFGCGTDTFNDGIWISGWYDPSPQPVDPNVAAYQFRHGNYDYFSNAVTWASGYSETLPNSFYLSSAPAFFSEGSGYTWPWVTPTSAPQFYTLPAKARYDAGTPFVQP